MLQMEKGLLLIRKPELHYYTVQLQTHELNSTSCRAHTHTHQAHTPFCKIYLPKQHVESTDQVLMRTDSSPSHSLHNDTSFFFPLGSLFHQQTLSFDHFALWLATSVSLQLLYLVHSTTGLFVGVSGRSVNSVTVNSSHWMSQRSSFHFKLN